MELWMSITGRNTNSFEDFSHRPRENHTIKYIQTNRITCSNGNHTLLVYFCFPERRVI